MQTTTKRFELIFEEGHHYFRDMENFRIAFADNSMCIWGDQRTAEDGLLYLDITKPVRIRTYGDDHKLCYTVPLISPSGETSGTPASLEEASRVVTTFGMRVTLEPKIKEQFQMITNLLMKAE